MNVPNSGAIFKAKMRYNCLIVSKTDHCPIPYVICQNPKN